MSDIAIRVENLSKLYRIGARLDHHATLRDQIAETLATPFRRLRGNGSQTAITHNHADTIWALKDVSFEVQRGEIVGIIGRNGAGKSTLLKILSRITDPTEGYAEIDGRVGTLLEVGTGFHPELTGRENIYLNGAILGMRRGELDRKFDEIVSFAEVEKFIDTPVKHYSSGMYVRLAFAVAAHLEPEVLIVDEVLAVGDAAFQKKCLGRMGDVAKEGRTVLFVSHNMAAIENLCGKAIFLEKGMLAGTSNLQEAILRYFGQPMSNEMLFQNGPVRMTRVEQVGQTIEISAEYDVGSTTLEIPCLGFVISDSQGNPVCGSNPVLDRAIYPENPRKRGIVTAIVEYPKLLNGTYRLSIWFGDGKRDFFAERDCLTFKIMNMASIRQLPASMVGPVDPICHWTFD